MKAAASATWAAFLPRAASTSPRDAMRPMVVGWSSSNADAGGCDAGGRTEAGRRVAAGTRTDGARAALGAGADIGALSAGREARGREAAAGRDGAGRDGGPGRATTIERERGFCARTTGGAGKTSGRTLGAGATALGGGVELDPVRLDHVMLDEGPGARGITPLGIRRPPLLRAGPETPGGASVAAGSGNGGGSLERRGGSLGRSTLRTTREASRSVRDSSSSGPRCRLG
jgi:hypothetical protein